MKGRKEVIEGDKMACHRLLDLVPVFYSQEINGLCSLDSKPSLLTVNLREIIVGC